MNGRNPDLPILDELGTRFEAMVKAAYGGEPANRKSDGVGRTRTPPAEIDRHAIRRRGPAAPSLAARERKAQAHRVGRRAVIVLVLLCLVAGVAFAALNGGSHGGHPKHTAPTLLGRDPGGEWSFSAYRDDGRLCTVFVPQGGELSGSCGPAPRAGRVRAGSAIVGGHRFVFGVAAGGVSRVTASLGGVGVGHDTAAGLVRAPLDRGAANDAGFPQADGWFVLDLGPVRSSSGSPLPARVVPLSPNGQRAGAPYLDCSLDVVGAACSRRIRSEADGR